MKIYSMIKSVILSKLDLKYQVGLPKTPEFRDYLKKNLTIEKIKLMFPSNEDKYNILNTIHEKDNDQLTELIKQNFPKGLKLAKSQENINYSENAIRHVAQLRAINEFRKNHKISKHDWLVKSAQLTDTETDELKAIINMYYRDLISDNKAKKRSKYQFNGDSMFGYESILDDDKGMEEIEDDV